MSVWDILLVVMLTVVVGWAVWQCVKTKKQGRNCCGNCAGCSQNCGMGGSMK